MENRKGTRISLRKRPVQVFPIFHFLFSVFLFSVGCGATGEPTPPSPPVPTAIADLTAQQAGDGVQLTFTLPSSSISGDKLISPPAVEILRGTLKPDGSPDSKSFRIVYTIPGALIDNYRSDGHVRFIDPIAPEETKVHPGSTIGYTVRTRASQKRASGDSNVISVRVFPVPERISSVEAQVNEFAIELSWPVPARTSAGDPLSSGMGYRIYRSEVNSSAPSSSVAVIPNEKGKSPSTPLASSETNSFSDTSFAFDRTYVYVVRSIVQVDGASLESSDSQPVTVTPRDTFPPAAPQNLVAVSPHCLADNLYVDLSWSINIETDLTGYRVYRSEEEGKRGRVLESFWLVPSYRDSAVPAGRRYSYTVTALDRAGNESPSSAPVVVLVVSEQCIL